MSERGHGQEAGGSFVHSALNEKVDVWLPALEIGRLWNR